MLRAGDHVPVTPLLEVVGNGLKAEPAQIGATGVNVGVTGGLTVMPFVVGLAQTPGVGVNVYIVVPVAAVLIVEGDHVPVMPLLEVVGNAPGVAFWQ